MLFDPDSVSLRRYIIPNQVLILPRTVAAVSWQIQASQQLPNHADATFLYWPFVLSMALAQSLGITTACVPYLKPLMDSVESGMIRNDDIRRRGKDLQSSSGYDQNQPGSSATSSQPKSPLAAGHELQNLRNEDTRATVSITVGGTESGRDWESASHSSQAQLIKQVKTWGITNSPAPGNKD